MPKLFKDLAETINRSKFETQVYEGFVERIPKYFRDYPEMMPLHSNPQGHSTTYFTIAEMIERHHKGEHFSVMKADEVLLIINILKSYINQCEPLVKHLSDDDFMHKFISNAKAFRTALEENKGASLKHHNDKHGVVERPRSAAEIIRRAARMI